jgi:hypothetical protein
MFTKLNFCLLGNRKVNVVVPLPMAVPTQALVLVEASRAERWLHRSRG